MTKMCITALQTSLFLSYLDNFSPESFWAGFFKNKAVKESNQGLIRVILTRKSSSKSEVAFTPVRPHRHCVLGISYCLAQFVHLHVRVRPITEKEEWYKFWDHNVVWWYLVMIWSSGLSSKACVYLSMLASTSPRWKFKIGLFALLCIVLHIA